MGISVTWADEAKTTIHVLYEGRWTFDEYLASSHDMTALLDSSSTPIDFVYEFRATALPADIMAQFSRMQNSPHVGHPQQGFMVLVGLTGILDSIATIYSNVFMKRASFAKADTYQEAIDLLVERRSPTT